MKRVLAQCDGSTVPHGLARDGREMVTITHRGGEANLNLSVPLPVNALHGQVDSLTEDLMMIAAYAFGIDQQVTRHFETDVHGDKWRRDILVSLGVRNPDFWSQASIHRCLADVLAFATDDVWSFHFTRAPVEQNPSLFLGFDVNAAMGDPDQVILVSGGLDSACAVVEQHVTFGRQPVLVSHSPAFHLASRQDHVRDHIAQRFRDWTFPLVPMAVNRSDGSDPMEYSMRTRAFLFASMGALIAVNLGLRDIVLADNGVVSLNLPLNDQIIGAHASRCTHPRFIRLFNELLKAVFNERGPILVNPLAARTRAETLQILKDCRFEQLVAATISCSHVQGLTGSQPQCGVCSQCIDRRAGTEAAGLQKFDPAERYKTDLFVDELEDGHPRTMALSFVRRAQQLVEASPEEMIQRYPELIDALPPAGKEQVSVARELTAMLARHGREVVDVMNDQIRRHSDRYLRARLPKHCLIMLLGEHPDSVQPSLDLREGPRQDDGDNAKRTSPYARWLASLPTGPRAVVSRLEQAQRAAEEPTRWSELRSVATGAGINPTRMHDVFRHHPQWREFIEAHGRGYWRLASSASANDVH